MYRDCIKTFCPGIGDSIIKGKKVRYHLIFTMGILLLVRQRLYIEMAPGACYIFRIAINSLRPSDAYMHQYTSLSLLQIMACHLVGAKLSSEPMLEYFQFEP